MARAALIQKNNKKTNISTRFAKERISLKKQIYNKSISLQERYSLVQKLNKMPKDSSKIRVRNLCFMTGRTRGVYRKFGLSRHKIRELAGLLCISGLTKSSW